MMPAIAWLWVDGITRVETHVGKSANTARHDVHKTMCGGSVLSFYHEDPGIEFKSPGLVASTFAS